MIQSVDLNALELQERITTHNIKLDYSYIPLKKKLHSQISKKQTLHSITELFLIYSQHVEKICPNYKNITRSLFVLYMIHLLKTVILCISR